MHASWNRRRGWRAGKAALIAIAVVGALIVAGIAWFVANQPRTAPGVNTGDAPGQSQATSPEAVAASQAEGEKNLGNQQGAATGDAPGGATGDAPGGTR